MIVASVAARTLPVTEVSHGEVAVARSIDPRTPDEVRAMVEDYFADIPVMVDIARCESQFRHTLPDGTVLHGKVVKADTGVMQINTTYHGARAKELGLDLTNFVDNMTYARDLYEREGTKPWNSSRSCWAGGEKLAMNR